MSSEQELLRRTLQIRKLLHQSKPASFMLSDELTVGHSSMKSGSRRALQACGCTGQDSTGGCNRQSERERGGGQGSLFADETVMCY